MRKNLKKQTAVLIVSAALAAQTSLAGYGAPLTPGDWKQEDGAWRFCDPEQNAYAVPFKRSTIDPESLIKLYSSLGFKLNGEELMELSL
jgi:hypothetical protein